MLVIFIVNDLGERSTGSDSVFSQNLSGVDIKEIQDAPVPAKAYMISRSKPV